MTKTLTEQWRDGTLPSGWYYVKDINNEIYIAHQYTYGPSICLYEEEVLAPVPSYDEYKRLEKKLAIATKALKIYMTFCRHPAEEALKKMEGAK